MKLVEIKRVASRSDGTFSTLAIDNLPICVCLERPWLDNRKGESCIPAGRYQAKRILSPKFGETFAITDVPGRDGIRFHKGNILEDTHGCIVLGESFNIWASGACSVASSGPAFAEFMQRLAGEHEFILVITNCSI